MRELRSRTDRNERRSRLRMLRGTLFFVLGVIVLSYLELELVERVHGSIASLDVALASDLEPVLLEWTDLLSAKTSDPPKVRALTQVSSPPVPGR